MGLSLTDLDSLSPLEFEHIFLSYNNRIETIQRQSWEIARFQALFSVIPYSKHSLSPSDICTFEWEKKRKFDEDRGDSKVVEQTRRWLRKVAER